MSSADWTPLLSIDWSDTGHWPRLLRALSAPDGRWKKNEEFHAAREKGDFEFPGQIVDLIRSLPDKELEEALFQSFSAVRSPQSLHEAGQGWPLLTHLCHLAPRRALPAFNALARAGGDVNAISKNAVTPLWAACWALAQKPTPCWAPPLPSAVDHEANEERADVARRLVSRLLDLGADPNRRPGAPGFFRGETPLHLAVASCAESSRALLEKGAKIGPINAKKENPLKKAIAEGPPGVARLLLQKGASATKALAGDPLDSTPAHWAAKHLNADALLALKEAGADFNAAETTATAERRPLHYALRALSHRRGHDAVQALLDNGANPALAGDESHWGLLLKHSDGRQGAGATHDFANQGPLTLAAEHEGNHRARATRELARRGLSLEEPLAYGRSVLATALAHSRADPFMIFALFESGAPFQASLPPADSSGAAASLVDFSKTQPESRWAALRERVTKALGEEGEAFMQRLELNRELALARAAAPESTPSPLDGGSVRPSARRL